MWVEFRLCVGWLVARDSLLSVTVFLAAWVAVARLFDLMSRVCWDGIVVVVWCVFHCFPIFLGIVRAVCAICW